MIKKPLLFVLATSIIALVSACGGGGGGGGTLPSGGSLGSPSSPATNAPGGGSSGSQNVTMALTVTIPGKKSSSRARGPQYIAPNSGSMTLTLLTVNGVAVSASAQGPFNLTPGPTNPACVVATNTTCTFQISAPVGTDIFLANTYSTSNGTGQPLGSGSILLSVKQNAQNSANLSLTGPVNSVQVVTGTPTLFNGNPIPAPQCSDCSLARGAGAQAKAHLQARDTAAAGAARSRASTATTTRKSPALAVISSPPPVPPVATTSRVFVIALDAAGNQIINPTTFDIPITLALALNGTPAGGVTLGVAYAGLTGEPTTSASTSADGGTVQVFAPSDTVTLTLTGTSAAQSSYAPSITGSYTPQGGTLQTTTPLAFTVYIGPAIAQNAASVSHVDPFTLGVAANVSDAYLNTGTAPTTAQIEADAYLSALNFNSVQPGTDPSWACTPYNEGGYYYVQCFSNAVVPAGGSLPLVFNVTPTGADGAYAYNELDVYSGGAINGANDTYVSETINVVTPTGVQLTPSPLLFSGACGSPTPCAFSQTATVYEFGYVGNINLSVGACPYFALNVASVADDGVSTFPVTVTPIINGTGPSPAVCTLTATDGNNNSATSSLQNTPLGVTVQ